MLLRIVFVAVALIAALLIYAATKPNTFRVQRSTVINASPEKVFPLINDFHNWPRWAPQDKEDSTMTRTYSGAPNGTGAVSEWKGSGSTGQGRMTITESQAPARISVQVDFAKPFHAHNLNQFALEPAGSSTRITWSMQGTNVYMMKLMSVFMNMDRVMGKHFETGLANLKTAAEQSN